jgi:hypothetical protein
MGYGAALSVVLAAFTFTGGKLTGYERDPTVDEVSRKEFLRKNRRRPIDQIVNELGEGRGTHMISTGVARKLEIGLLTQTQESPPPVTRSAGHSASRPTTALTSRSLLRRRYVLYTQQYYSPCSNLLSLPETSFHVIPLALMEHVNLAVHDQFACSHGSRGLSPTRPDCPVMCLCHQDSGHVLTGLHACSRFLGEPDA